MSVGKYNALEQKIIMSNRLLTGSGKTQNMISYIPYIFYEKYKILVSMR